MFFEFLKCFNLTEFFDVRAWITFIILLVSFNCMLFIYIKYIRISKIFIYTFALMLNIWIHLMNLLKTNLFSFLRTKMITSSFRMCLKTIALKIHELFDIFELFKNFWILEMWKSRSMWSLISLEICDDCMLFRCFLISCKTCLIVILKSSATTFSSFFESLFNRLSMLFLSIFFAAIMFVIDWRVYDNSFRKRFWLVVNSDCKKNFFVIVLNDLQKV